MKKVIGWAILFTIGAIRIFAFIYDIITSGWYFIASMLLMAVIIRSFIWAMSVLFDDKKTNK